MESHRLRWSLILLLASPLFAQQTQYKPAYREVFGKDYEIAVNIISMNPWWSDTLANNGIEPRFALSIIFPELIRYSSISDYVEVKALEVLYVQYGSNYADFSIGLFQMKPSFAEQVEADLLEYKLVGQFPFLSGLDPNLTDDASTRKKRILRLKDEYYQILYLEAFIKIMESRYADYEHSQSSEKIIFYSTAYNCGYRKGEKVIKGESHKARFYLGMLSPDTRYNYSDIALDYFKSVKK